MPRIPTSFFLRQFVILTILGQNCHSYMVGIDPYHRREIIDPEGRFQMEWLVGWTDKVVTFHLTVQTTGYIGFGLSKTGEMAGADVIIGGVQADGRPYFGDCHGQSEGEPELDKSQDWKFISASENETYTMLSFFRTFDTCDPQDYQITEDHVVIIWAFGATDADEVTFREGTRGTYHAYLLTPEYSPRIITEPHGKMQRVLDASGRVDKSVLVWSVNIDMEVPVQETLYWCMIHKSPRQRRKSQVIGFNVRFHKDDTETKHLRDLTVTKCRVPRGSKTKPGFMFERFTRRNGENCLTLGDPTQTDSIPGQYCNELYETWGIGGPAHFHPLHVGLPLESEEYFMIQIHLNNPELLENSRLNISLDFFYSKIIRPNNGGMISVRHNIPGLSPSFLIPPSTPNHHIRTICGSGCTRDMIPAQGITVYGALLHTHSTGRGIRIRHFRGNQELPFIAIDDNFLPLYQPVRNFHEERLVMPGDQLMVECIHDTTLAKRTVVGGLSTSQEMCLAGIFHYEQLTDIIYCESEIRTVNDREHFLAGVENITWSVDRLEYIVDPGQPLAGKTVTEVSDNYVDWTPERKEELQEYHFYRPRMNRCQRELWTLGPNAISSVEPGVEVTFPSKITPYQRENPCLRH